MEYSSAVLELMDILGTENTFGLGFQVDGSGIVEVDKISFQLSILPFRGTGQPLFKTYSLFEENFSTANLSGWSIVDQGTVYAPSSWRISKGTLRQDSNICQQNLEPSAVDMLGTQAICRATQELADFQMAVDLRSEDDDAIGVLFRYQDPANYYRFSWDLQRRVRRLVKCGKGKFTLLAQDVVGYEIGKTYRVAIVARGPQFAVAIDGTPIFHAWDPEIGKGAIGMYCSAEQGAVFDNLRIEGASARTYRLMSPIGDLTGASGELIQVQLAPTSPIPDTRYWSEPSLSGASFTDGIFKWGPSPIEAGLHRIRFMAETESGFDSQTIEIRVEGMNHPPSIDPIDPQTVIEGHTLTLVPTITDPDGDPIRLTWLGLPAGATGSDTQMSWTPTLGQTGHYLITLAASDGSKVSLQSIPVTVRSDQAPVFESLNPITVVEGSTIAFAVPVSDPDGDSITLVVDNPPAGLRFENGQLIWMPDSSQTGHYVIAIVASDGLLESRAILPISVTRINHPPVIGQVPTTISIMAGRFLSIPVEAWDPDGDSVTLSSPNLPSGAIFSGNTVTWIPGSIQSGLYTIEIVATDGMDHSSKWVVIRVF